MHPIIVSETVHPAGESKIALASAVESELVIDTPGGRYRASFDDRTPVSALGPLVLRCKLSAARPAGIVSVARIVAEVHMGLPRSWPAVVGDVR